jgi:heptose I phosphotransferase
VNGPIFSGCAGSFWQRLAHGVRKVWQRADWPGLAGTDWPSTIMQLGVTDDFHAKQGRSTGRWVVEKDGRKLGVYLKRHYRLPWWSGVLAALWPSKRWSPALQELDNLAWAQAQGLPVPAPVAAGEYIGPWGRLQSILAVEELADMLPLHQAIPAAARTLDAETFRRWKKGLVAELARLSRELHGRRVFHKDLYLCHFFVARADLERVPEWRGRVFVIDFHRLARHAITWPIWLVKDLGQLFYSSEIEGVDGRDRMRFWRHYVGRRRSSRTMLARLVRWKKDLYERHNAKHQAARRTTDNEARTQA